MNPLRPLARGLAAIGALLLVTLVAAPAFAAPAMSVSQLTGLTDGQTITISGSGFKPNLSSIAMGQCVEGYNGPSDCNTAGGATFRNADANGNVAPFTITVKEVFGAHDCTKVQCMIAAAPLPERDRRRDRRRQHGRDEDQLRAAPRRLSETPTPTAAADSGVDSETETLPQTGAGDSVPTLLLGRHRDARDRRRSRAAGSGPSEGKPRLMRFRALTHSAAALCAVGGLALGGIALAGTASAVDDRAGDQIGKVTGSTTFNCTAGTFPSFEYVADVTVTAFRETAGDTDVALVAELTDMPGVIPVSLGKVAITDELALDLGGTAATLAGNGQTTLTAKAPFPVPKLYGDFTSAATSLSATVTTFKYALPSFNMGGTCTPTSGAALGTLTIETGTAPTETPTASPTESPTESPDRVADGEPHRHRVDRAGGVPGQGRRGLRLRAAAARLGVRVRRTITVSGYREEEGGDVILSAKMTDIPGISPVPIDGDMTVELDGTVGGKAVTLKGASHVSAAPKETVPVPTLKGTVAADEDELEVTISAFEFEIVTAGLTVDGALRGRRDLAREVGRRYRGTG